MTAKLAPLMLIVVATASCDIGAQMPDAGDYSGADYDVDVTRGVLVPMRDGVRLSVDIYAPRGVSGPIPAILTSTPYDNNGSRESAIWFAERGYVVVAADVRGRYDSEGEWRPFNPLHKTDGYDLVEWIAAQPWCTCKVGMIGGSYLGWTQWWTASTAPPHLAAIAPKVAPPDHFENLPYQNGALIAGWMLDWAAMMSGRTMQIAGAGGYLGWSENRQDPPHTPYIEINASRGLRSAPWFEEWYHNNLSTTDYWQGIAYQTPESYSSITVPSLSFTGWFDANYPGSPMNYLGMKEHGATPEARRPSMVIGPWVHGINTQSSGGIDYGPDAVIDVEGYVARWFDHFLKGEDNGVTDDPPVYVFVMGENKWHAEEDWPLPQTEWTNYYLTSNEGANSSDGDGVLTTEAPSDEGSDTYLYDPLHPTRDPFDTWPNKNGHIDGALDTSASADGDEVLVYRTPPLEEAIEVTGPIEIKLYALHLRTRHRLVRAPRRHRPRRLLRPPHRSRDARPQPRPRRRGPFQQRPTQHHRAGRGLRVHAPLLARYREPLPGRPPHRHRDLVELVPVLPAEPQHRRGQCGDGYSRRGRGSHPACVPWG